MKNGALDIFGLIKKKKKKKKTIYFLSLLLCLDLPLVGLSCGI